MRINLRKCRIVSPSSDSLTRQFQKAIVEQIAKLKNCVVSLSIPSLKTSRHYPDEKPRPSHMTPEIFIQLSGATKFDCPREKFLLLPEAICLMPRMTPHSETAVNYRGTFKNMVVMFGENMLTIHLASKKNAAPAAGEGRAYRGQTAEMTLRLTNDSIDLFRENTPGSTEIGRELLIAAFYCLLKLIKSPSQPSPFIHPKVHKCRQLVGTHIADERLGVSFLAEVISCSADYLSSLFHQVMGQTLIQYIHRQRVERAKYLLKTSDMNVSQVAFACGFSDPAYLARIFRRITGLSPKIYRRRSSGE